MQKQLKPTHADPKRFMQSTTTGCLRKIWFATNRYLQVSVETASMAWGPVEASKRRKIDFRTEECATSSVADPT